MGIGKEHFMIEPVGYLDMIALLKKCALVMTDSGGLQKEAFFFKKCCITVREQTEWSELVEGGYNCLAGSSEAKIFKCYQKMIAKEPSFNKNYYGSGNASKLVVENIINE